LAAGRYNGNTERFHVFCELCSENSGMVPQLRQVSLNETFPTPCYQPAHHSKVYRLTDLQSSWERRKEGKHTEEGKQYNILLN
jgi:hypothetical protein